MKYDDLTIRFEPEDARAPFDGHARTLPHPGAAPHGGSESDFAHPLPFPPGPDDPARPPFPPGPHSFVGPDPHRNPEFPPFGEMEDYDSLPTDAKLLHRLRGLSHKLHFLSGSIGGQKRILAILAACPGITQRQLMDLVRVRASSLSEVLGKLEAAGQIRRQVCPFDRRMVQVYLTEAGESAAAAQKDDESAALFDCLTDAEKTALLKTVEKLDDAWAKRCPPPPRKPAEFKKI